MPGPAGASDAVPALRGRLEEAERLVRQLQAAQQAAGQRLQECQAAQLGRADVVAIVEDVGKRQRDEATGVLADGLWGWRAAWLRNSA